MGIQGKGIVCLLGTGFGCNAGPLINLTVPLTVNGTRGVGLGGAPIAITRPLGIRLSVEGNPWTAGTAMLGTVTIMGFVHGPASGGAATAGQASGVVQLVTPTMLSTSIANIAAIPSFGILNLHFVPEPGTFLLLASGVVGLAVAGLRRRRV